MPISNSESDQNVNSEVDSTANQEKRKPLINVYDLNTVKFTLDAAVRSILLDEKLFKEDHTMSNIKLISGILACSGAVTAYFTKVPIYALVLCIM